jgi:hypothetical protein
MELAESAAGSSRARAAERAASWQAGRKLESATQQSRRSGEQLQWLGVLSATMVRYNGWMYKLYGGAYRDENCM